MGFLDAFWHLINFFAPAFVVPALAAGLAKLVWWRELRATPWRRLWASSAALAAVLSVAGLVIFGRDGKMATYAAMVAGCALGLWWAGFRRAAG